jgi:hypothetical protein
LKPEEFGRLFDADAAALGPDERAILARHAVPVYRTEHEVDFGNGPVRLPVWIVAVSDHAVLGYDEAEERYGNGIVGEGDLVEWHTFADEGLPLSVIEFRRLVEFRRRGAGDSDPGI